MTFTYLKIVDMIQDIWNYYNPFVLQVVTNDLY